MSKVQLTRRVIVGITGASGAVFGIRILERLREFNVEIHSVISPWGARVIEHETPHTVKYVRGLADKDYRPNAQDATLSSGSYRTDGMIIAPCSMKTLANIANGLSEGLIPRAADVILKERRNLVLLLRESPFNSIHLSNMLRLSKMGVTIFPPVPAFYNHPQTLDDITDHIVTRALDQIGLYSDSTSRWDGTMSRCGPAPPIEDMS